MAASLNKVFLIGNLTRDPELRYVPSGSAVANFTLAVNRIYKDKSGERKEEVSFIKVVVWGKMAETCGEYLTKGRSVMVEGRLQSRSWEAQDGQKRSTLEVIALGVQFLGAKGEKAPEASTSEPAAELESVDLDAELGKTGPARGEHGAGEEEIPF
ncbi:MAG: single-stranded DNA-binding protein [Candidatus Omnitrophica bacterium]|nr:single-stranded DNA-binding protein [Candidatus Omnitrophota bacterium]